MMSTFPPQAGMQQHPGMPHGQPMPGQVPHPQGMGGPMQMHPGVSGPHGQQVSQAGPMVGMPPGMVGPGNPSAHAMSHLAPNGGQMMPQQGVPHQLMNNPQAMAMHHNHQQRILYQRQQMLRQQQANMMNQGQPVQPQFNPQQLANMQANGGQMGVNLPPHLQQQMAANNHLLQQQAMEAAARQQAAQNNLVAQHAQHMAMQHAASQGSNQSHPSSQPGQPTQQPPMRPTSVMGTSSMEARSSPAPTSGPQQTPQPGPQHSQPPSQPSQQPPTSGPQGQPTQTPSSQPPQNSGSNAPQQVGQGQNPNQTQNRVNSQQANMANQHMQQVLLQQRAQQAAAAAAQAQNRSNGATLLQAFAFANKLGSYRAKEIPNNIEFWRDFVKAHFTEDAVYRMVLRFNSDGQHKVYEVNASGLPRFFFTQYEYEIDQIQVVLDGNQEKRLSETHQVVQADRSRMLHWFRDGTQLVWNGIFRIIYAGDKIEHLSFETKDHQQYLPRSKLEELCAQASPYQNKSPRTTKTQGKQRNQQLAEPAFDMRRLPRTAIADLGIHQGVQQYLELGETMNYMQPLIAYSKDHPELSVPSALASLVQVYQQNPPQVPMQNNFPPGQNPNPQQAPGQIQGAFPPGGPQARSAAMQSPMLSNGSPQVNLHTPSPHQNMAPPMVPQLSQQGSAGSSQTSPNVSTKRRRSTAAGVKGEDGETNGAGPKVKQSPRPAGNAKRLKGS